MYQLLSAKACRGTSCTEGTHVLGQLADGPWLCQIWKESEESAG